MGIGRPVIVMAFGAARGRCEAGCAVTILTVEVPVCLVEGEARDSVIEVV